MKITSHSVKVKKLYFFIDVPDSIDLLSIESCLQDEKIKRLILNSNKENDSKQEKLISKSLLNNFVYSLKNQVSQLPNFVNFTKIRLAKEKEAKYEISEYIKPKIQLESQKIDSDIFSNIDNDFNKVKDNISYQVNITPKKKELVLSKKKKYSCFGCF